MKKLLLTALLLVTTLQSFSQSKELTLFLFETQNSVRTEGLDYAVSRLDSAIGVNYNDTLVTSLISIVMMKKGELDVATDVLQKHYASYKDSVNFIAFLASAYMIDLDYKNAAKYFVEVLKLNDEPEGFPPGMIYTGLVDCYRELGEFDKALQVIDSFNNKQDMSHLVNLAKVRLYNDMGDPSAIEFLANLDSVNKVIPLNYSSYDEYGIAYYNKGNYEKATEYFIKAEESKKISDREWLRLYLLAESYIKLNDKSKACFYYDKFLKTFDETQLKNIEKKKGLYSIDRKLEFKENAEKQAEKLNCR